MTHADPQTMPIVIPSKGLWHFLLRRWSSKICRGRLRLVYPDGQEEMIEGGAPGPEAVLQLNNFRPIWRLAFSGSLGFSKSYIEGDWDSPDIATFLEFALANEEKLDKVIEPPFRPLKGLAKLRHRLHRNSRAGSKRNIAYHYDLGNAFYGEWLDETMTYSSALYTAPGQDMADAQNAKYDRIIRELGIGANDTVLEIGCGWGGFAERAAATTGCRVTCLTLSREQAAFARERMEKAGLSDKVEIRLEDYRDCQGLYSKIVSIEMFEAVGEEHWPIYFNRVRELLEIDGQAMIQVITIDEAQFDAYRRDADFIQTYIFPGGMLPSVTVFEKQARAGGLEVEDGFRFGRDYERTLLEWDETFTGRWSAIEPLGFDQRFYRMWRYYLHYCAAGFRTGRLDVVQFRLSKG
ncbi:SAM-dependent methyltransferase [Rhizobium halophytocola]|uniref:Cyclopropane-fatty-acyl-phospholipid synthase n=1 Tax=Rhizobium halophytocola TaxID=735519 RepID=A0ABS4DTR0_9HYPH|nr:cyclopropane-fatty-acyl-phospholipid synthase family protein [Rhizobium halophytocola]MBP1849077.1 cyclopropane-fatty-acyl-phospholipid synthase [Rhizobium halophytocola]